MSRGILYFVSSNKNKFDEMIDMLEDDFPYKLVCKKLDLNEYQGDEDFIVRKKCLEAVKLVNGPVIVEDTSLGFDAFIGLPGPYIKHFLDSIGAGGLYRMLKEWENKDAIAGCRIAYCESPTSEPIIFKGLVRGTIVEPQGIRGFGFDCCFQPLDSYRTFAQMDKEHKNSVSHRYLAVKEMSDYFKNNK